MYAESVHFISNKISLKMTISKVIFYINVVYVRLFGSRIYAARYIKYVTNNMLQNLDQILLEQLKVTIFYKDKTT